MLRKQKCNSSCPVTTGLSSDSTSPRGNLRGVFEQARKMASPASLNSTGKTGDPAKGYFKSFVFVLPPVPPEPAVSKEEYFYRSVGPRLCLPLEQFLQKPQRVGTGGSHALHHQRPWAQAIYSRKMNQIVISHFCFLWITKRSQLFPGLPSGGRKDEGREEIPASVAMGRECFKIGAAYKLFSLSGNNLCNCW